MPPIWSLAKNCIPSDFQQLQHQSWDNASRLPPNPHYSPDTQPSPKVDTEATTHHATAWEVRAKKENSSPDVGQRRELWGDEDFKAMENHDEDAAKPAVDFQRVWKEALL